MNKNEFSWFRDHNSSSCYYDYYYYRCLNVTRNPVNMFSRQISFTGFWPGKKLATFECVEQETTKKCKQNEQMPLLPPPPPPPQPSSQPEQCNNLFITDQFIVAFSFFWYSAAAAVVVLVGWLGLSRYQMCIIFEREKRKKRYAKRGVTSSSGSSKKWHT